MRNNGTKIRADQETLRGTYRGVSFRRKYMNSIKIEKRKRLNMFTLDLTDKEWSGLD